MEREEIEKLVAQIKALDSPDLWRSLIEEIQGFLQKRDPDEVEDLVLRYAIDSPLEIGTVDGEGRLRMRSPFRYGFAEKTGWQVFSITPVAQEEILKFLLHAKLVRGDTAIQGAPRRTQ